VHEKKDSKSGDEKDLEGSKDVVGTPSKLLQYWVEVPLEGKLDVLWSFVKTHLKQKVLVFLTSCKQVRKITKRKFKFSFFFILFHLLFEFIVLNHHLKNSLKISAFPLIRFSSSGFLIFINFSLIFSNFSNFSNFFR